jgi:hypothetical protein
MVDVAGFCPLRQPYKTSDSEKTLEIRNLTIECLETDFFQNLIEKSFCGFAFIALFKLVSKNGFRFFHRLPLHIIIK